MLSLFSEILFWGRVPPSRFSVLPSRLQHPPAEISALSIKSKYLDDYMKKWLSAPINPTFRPNIVQNCGKDLCFLFLVFDQVLGQTPPNFGEDLSLFFFSWYQSNSGTTSEHEVNFRLNFGCIPNAFGQVFESVPTTVV